jgi:hypothetical protein
MAMKRRGQDNREKKHRGEERCEGEKRDENKTKISGRAVTQRGEKRHARERWE